MRLVISVPGPLLIYLVVNETDDDADCGQGFEYRVGDERVHWDIENFLWWDLELKLGWEGGSTPPYGRGGVGYGWFISRP